MLSRRSTHTQAVGSLELNLGSSILLPCTPTLTELPKGMEILHMPQWFRETGQGIKSMFFPSNSPTLLYVVWRFCVTWNLLFCFKKYISRKKNPKQKQIISKYPMSIFENELLLGKENRLCFYIQSAFFSAKINGWFSFKVKISNPSRWSYVGLPQKSTKLSVYLQPEH